jgi:anaerobic selenocysteine-containing dehydrogenase
MTETLRSFCRICTSLCGILVDVQGDEVLRVRGDRDHPVTAGYTCAKGRALPRMHHDPRRLEQPLVRRDGELQPVPWDTCLDEIGDRLSAIVTEHGPAAVGIYFGSGVGMDAVGYRMSEALHAAIGTPARFSPLTIDGTAKTVVAGLVGSFPGLATRPDWDRVQLLVLIGANPVVSHGHAAAMPSPLQTLRSLRETGEVWVLDPRCTESAALATEHLSTRPGTDYAVLAHLVRDLLVRGADPTVLAQRCVDVEALRRAVAPFDTVTAARTAGIAAEQLTALTEAVRRHGRLAIETGTGVTMSATANVTQWLAYVTMVLTDSMNRPGGVWFHPGFTRRMDNFELPIIPAELLFGPGAPSRPDLQGFLGEWPCAALSDEIDAGNIKAFLNLGGSLITAFPDEQALRSSLSRLELFVTLDVVHNETTALSTHVLPTKGQLERADITLWDFLSPRVGAQYTDAVMAPVGQRRSSWWVLAEIGRRLGHDLVAAMSGRPQPDPSDEDLLESMMRGARCTFEELVAEGWVEAPLELPAAWVEQHLDRAGGWRLAPAPFLAQLAALVGAAPGDGLVLTPRRQKNHLNAQLRFLGDQPDVLIHPDDAAQAGLVDGGGVIVSNGSGEIQGTVVVTADMRPGVVSVPHGFEEANVNRLTDNAQGDPLTGMALYGGIRVSVRPVVPQGIGPFTG